MTPPYVTRIAPSAGGSLAGTTADSTKDTRASRSSTVQRRARASRATSTVRGRGGSAGSGLTVPERGWRDAASANARKMRAASAETSAERSGCHWTATTQRCAGSSIASTSTSMRTVGTRPDARMSSVTAW